MSRVVIEGDCEALLSVKRWMKELVMSLVKGVVKYSIVPRKRLKTGGQPYFSPIYVDALKIARVT